MAATKASYLAALKAVWLGVKRVARSVAWTAAPRVAPSVMKKAVLSAGCLVGMRAFHWVEMSVAEKADMSVASMVGQRAEM